MIFTTCPTVIEIYDDTNDVAAKVEAFDEAASTVTINHVTSPQEWPALSAAILRALGQIHPNTTPGAKQSEMKHTPGPWIGAGPSFGDPLPHYTTEILVEAENEDGDCQPICTLPFDCLDTENEANARLIAAAPELLEALDTLCNRIELESATPLDWPAYTQARAAIAKATGAQHG